MRALVLSVIILSQLSVSCSENLNCVEPAANFSYTFIPEAKDPTACQNSTPAQAIEKSKCKNGGKVVISNKNNDTVQIKTPAEADQHMKDSGNYAYSGGVHDDNVKNLSATEQADTLQAIPAQLKPTWQVFNPASKSNPTGINFGPNGCGIWATTVCDRILGLEKGPLTQTEWDKTYADLGSRYGVTPFYLIANYYQRKGFCSETTPLSGHTPGYVRMKDSLSKGCDVKLFFARKSSVWWLPSSNPHIETVVDVVIPDKKTEQPYLHTNSWGTYAKVAGGFCTEFEHERNHAFGHTDKEDKENFAWPANDARVWVQTTCDCAKMPNVEELLAL